RQTEDLLAKVKADAAAAAKDRRLLARLLETREPREGPKYSRDDQGMLMALAEPTAEEQFASAFRDRGLDVDAGAVAEAATRLRERPAVVVTELIAALDEWANQLQLHGKEAVRARTVVWPPRRRSGQRTGPRGHHRPPPGRPDARQAHARRRLRR